MYKLPKMDRLTCRCRVLDVLLVATLMGILLGLVAHILAENGSREIWKQINHGAPRLSSIGEVRGTQNEGVTDSH